MANPIPQPQTCLRCNADLVAGDERCPRCGWVNHYRNEAQRWEYQQAQQWQPTTIDPIASVEGVGDDELPGPLGRLYSWLLAPRHRPFTLATLAVLILIAVIAYYLAQGSAKPYPSLIIALASPTAAQLLPTAAPTAVSGYDNRTHPLPISPPTPVAFTPADSNSGGFHDPPMPTPGPPTATPTVAHYTVNPATIQASHILTITTDAGQLTFVLFYDAAPATVTRLTNAVDRELFTSTEVRHDPDFRLIYLAASQASSEVSFEQNNLPLTSGVLVDDPGAKWSDYTPVSIAVVEDPTAAQRAHPLVIYGRLVGAGITNAAHRVTDITYVICSNSDQQDDTSPCHLTYSSP